MYCSCQVNEFVEHFRAADFDPVLWEQCIACHPAGSEIDLTWLQTANGINTLEPKEWGNEIPGIRKNEIISKQKIKIRD